VEEAPLQREGLTGTARFTPRVAGGDLGNAWARANPTFRGPVRSIDWRGPSGDHQGSTPCRAFFKGRARHAG